MSLMTKISRRTLLQLAASAGLGGRLAYGAGRGLSIGVTDWNLNLGANPDALPLAALPAASPSALPTGT